MADFEITTKDASDIGFNSMKLNAELTALDDIYDAAIVSFEYGKESDLSDGVETKATGIFELNGTEGIEIDGLDEDTTYYFRAKAESLAYDSEVSVENAINKDGFLEVWLSHSDILDTMWNNEVLSEKFWNIVTHQDLPVTIEGNGTYEYSVQYDEEENCCFLQIEQLTYSAGTDEGVDTTIDLTDIESLKLAARVRLEDNIGPYITINDDEVLEENQDEIDNWVDYTIDVSSYSGENNVNFGKRTGSNGTAYIDYKDIRLE